MIQLTHPPIVSTCHDITSKWPASKELELEKNQKTWSGKILGKMVAMTGIEALEITCLRNRKFDDVIAEIKFLGYDLDTVNNSETDRDLPIFERIQLG